jgi:hypothetical protein
MNPVRFSFKQYFCAGVYIFHETIGKPGEDRAETRAHYLHIVDTLETARAFGLSVKPGRPDEPSIEPDQGEVGDDDPFDRLIRQWFTLTFAINGINRSVGQKDPYPFVLSDRAIAKLGFVHRVIHRTGGP